MSVVQAQKDLEAIAAQIEKLQAQAEKVRIYIEMARVYEGVPSVVAPKPRAPGGIIVPRRGGRPPGGVGSAAKRAAIEIIREKGQRIPSRALYPMLEAQGITIGGKDPLNGMSKILSQAPELTASKALGWGLAEWKDEPVVDASSERDDPIEPAL